MAFWGVICKPGISKRQGCFGNLHHQELLREPHSGCADTDVTTHVYGSRD